MHSSVLSAIFNFNKCPIYVDNANLCSTNWDETNYSVQKIVNTLALIIVITLVHEKNLLWTALRYCPFNIVQDHYHSERLFYMTVMDALPMFPPSNRGLSIFMDKIIQLRKYTFPQSPKARQSRLLCLYSSYTLLKLNKVLCRWFRFAQLAKGKKFRP